MSNGKSPPKLSTGSKAVALIAGPTASGKSDLAVALALAIERRGGRAVVINADSAQVYRDLHVLSARPSEADMHGIDHRLFGTWDGALPCSAAAWADAARQVIAGAHADGAVPILVGGTGLYLRTLLFGIAPVPPIDPVVREAVRALPVSDAFAALQAEDADRAARLHAADATRIARALEVVRSSGRTLAQWQTSRTGGIAGEIDLFPLILLPERAALFARCDTRFTQMLEQGAENEVAALLARDLPPSSPVMRAIGVREIVALLRGEITRDETRARGQQATRNYAKRQYTWFRHQPPADWPVAHDNSSSETKFETLFRYCGLT